MDLSTGPGAEDLLSDLDSAIPAVRLQAIRRLKNESIGNPKRKKALLEAGALRALVARLRAQNAQQDSAESEQLLRALASFMALREGSSHARTMGVPGALVQAVCTSGPPVQLAALAALAAYARQERDGIWLRDAPPELSTRLSELLATAGPSTAAVADVLAVVSWPKVAARLVDAGAVHQLCMLLTRPGTAPARTALLRALSRLLHTLADSVEDLSCTRRPGGPERPIDGWTLLSPQIRSILLLITRSETEPKLDRYLAAACLADWATLVGEGETTKVGCLCAGVKTSRVPIVRQIVFNEDLGT